MRTRGIPPAERTRSFEGRVVDARSLDLVETRCAGDHHHAIKEPSRGLALRGWRHHRSEERDVAYVDHRRTDVVAHGVHTLGVTLAESSVQRGVIGRSGELDF